MCLTTAYLPASLDNYNSITPCRLLFTSSFRKLRKRDMPIDYLIMFLHALMRDIAYRVFVAVQRNKVPQ